MNKIQQFFRDRQRAAILNKQFKNADFGIPGFNLLPPMKLDLDVDTSIENVELFKHLLPSDNQFNLPACCGFTWGNYIETKLAMQGYKFKSGYQLDSQKIWQHGRHMFFDDSTTGGLHLSQGFDACKDIGLFSSDATAKEVTSLSAIYRELKNGPIVTALKITTGWTNPPHENGYIKPSGTYIGSHAILIVGVTVQNNNIFVHLMNSWGEDWGWHGIATLSAEYYLGANVECPLTVVGDICIPEVEKLLVRK